MNNTTKIDALETAKNKIVQKCENLAKKYDMFVEEINFGELDCIFFYNNTLEFSFNGYVKYSDAKSSESIGTQFTCAYKTPKGYISSKKLPVAIANCHDVTLEEASALLEFDTDAVKNTFDPFWHENEARRRNACAWNHIANNYLQDF